MRCLWAGTPRDRDVTKALFNKGKKKKLWDLSLLVFFITMNCTLFFFFLYQTDKDTTTLKVYIERLIHKQSFA